MKTRINLYLNEFKPPKELLTLGRMLIVAAVCFFLVLCYGFYQRANLAKEQRTVMQLEEQKDAVQKNLLEVQMAYASRGTDEALKKEVDELNQLYLSKLALYDVIRNLKMSTDVNYASTLMDVARASSNSMSISRVVLNGKRMDIKGKVVSGDEVPVFIDKFKPSASTFCVNISKESLADIVSNKDNAKWVYYEIINMCCFKPLNLQGFVAH